MGFYVSPGLAPACYLCFASLVLAFIEAHCDIHILFPHITDKETRADETQELDTSELGGTHYNPSTWKPEGGGSQVGGQCGIHKNKTNTAMTINDLST